MSLSGFGQDHDLVTKQILLEIQEDDDLAQAIVTNRRAKEITDNDNFWKERLIKYFPEFVLDKADFPKLTWREFYIIISLFHSFQPTPGHYGSAIIEYDPNFAVDNNDVDFMYKPYF